MVELDYDFELLKQQADDEHRRNLDAIERVRRMHELAAKSKAALSPPEGGNGKAPKAPPKKTRGKGKHGAVLSAVRAAINGTDGKFTFKAIAQRIGEDSPKLGVKGATVRVILKKLTTAGVIEVVKQGIGRTPTEYRKV